MLFTKGSLKPAASVPNDVLLKDHQNSNQGVAVGNGSVQMPLPQTVGATSSSNDLVENLCTRLLPVIRQSISGELDTLRDTIVGSIAVLLERATTEIKTSAEKHAATRNRSDGEIATQTCLSSELLAQQAVRDTDFLSRMSDLIEASTLRITGVVRQQRPPAEAFADLVIRQTGSTDVGTTPVETPIGGEDVSATVEQIHAEHNSYTQVGKFRHWEGIVREELEAAHSAHKGMGTATMGDHWSKRVMRQTYLLILPFLPERLWLPEPPRDSTAARILHSSTFEFLVLCMILANAVALAFQAEANVTRDDENLSTINYICVCFLLFFAVEVIARILVHRMYFFIGEMWRWHLLDLSVVAVGIVGTITSPSAMSILRILRLFRVAKLLRSEHGPIACHVCVQLHAFKSSMLPFLSLIIVYGMVIFSLATVFVTGCGNMSPVDEGFDDMEALFGSASRAMRTLVAATTNGLLWLQVMKALEKAGAEYVFVLVAFIIFHSTVVLNVFNAVLSDTVMRARVKDTDTAALGPTEEEECARMCCRAFLSLVEESVIAENRRCGTPIVVDTESLRDGLGEDGKIPIRGLRVGVNGSEAFMDKLNLVHSLPQIDLNAFVEICMSMKYTSRCLDIVHVGASLERHVDDFHRWKCTLQKTLANMLAEQDRIVSHLNFIGDLAKVHSRLATMEKSLNVSRSK